MRCTSDCGSGYVSGLSRTVLMTEKTAVFAPIPTAITTIATAVKPGVFRSDRNAKRMSRQIDSNDTNEELTVALRPLSGLCRLMPPPVIQRSLPLPKHAQE